MVTDSSSYAPCPEGFTIEETGGGCTAWVRTIECGDRILICDSDDGNAPYPETTSWAVSVYTERAKYDNALARIVRWEEQKSIRSFESRDEALRYAALAERAENLIHRVERAS